jgi:hypothetical protein
MIIQENEAEVEEIRREQKALPRMKYPLQADNVAICFQRPPIGVGRKAQLTLMTVDYAIGGLNKLELDFCQTNRGWMEFAVAGTILWMRLIKPDILTRVAALGLFEIPLRLWSKVLGPWCNDVRHFGGIGFKDEKEDNTAASMIRKIANLSGRDLKPADFEKEAKSIRANRSAKAVPGPGKSLTCGGWLPELQVSIRNMIGEISSDMLEEMRFRTIEEWWATRRAWVPSGSSSQKEEQKAFKKKDFRLRSEDRPTKAQTIETISYDDLLEVLSGVPRSTARKSTKPEPGFKRRALYALDDFGTYIASYASMDMEKHLSKGGMAAKQTPQDIVEWLRADILRSEDPRRIWLSLDYADFNKEHSKLAMCMLNLELANMWCGRMAMEKSSDIMAMKAICANWTALAHLNAYCTEEDGSETRHFSGLWSGHRDTARDNTMLHWCYSDIVKRKIKEKIGEDIELLYFGVCGDDEDGLHADWTGMAAYLGMHRVCQLNLNPSKQLADWYGHEFLQRQANKGMLPVRPLAPMIATLSTGSWYKASHIYYDTVIKSLSDNCMEIIARGANPRIMRTVIASMINHMMTMDDGERVIELEWWDYRHGGDGTDRTDSLWHGTGDCLPHPVMKEDYLIVGEGAPSLATQDWLSNKGRWLEDVSQADREIYAQRLMRDTYKSYYGAYRQLMRNRLALENFGLRRNVIKRSKLEEMASKGTFKLDNVQSQAEMEKQLLDELDQSTEERRPMEYQVLLDRLGMDENLLTLIGGMGGFLNKASNEECSRYEKAATITQVQPPLGMTLTDPALTSWWKQKYLEADYTRGL